MAASRGHFCFHWGSMSPQSTRALRISFLAMIGTVVYLATKHIVYSRITIWESHILTILFVTASAFAVSKVMRHREEQSRSDLLDEIERRQKIEQQLHLQSTALESAANAIVITDRESTIV